MDIVWNGILAGLKLLFSGNPALWEIILLSLRVSGIALLISSIIGIPSGAILGLRHFRGRRLTQAFIYTGMGLPPVVVGLGVYLLLSRHGVLGPLNWPFVPSLYSVQAMILAQVIIAAPVIIGFTMSAVAGVDPDLSLQLRSLGATRSQVSLAVLREARLGVIVALVGGFGSIISEVGAVMMVGGNIEHSTRVLTTAIVLSTGQGDWSLALGLGLVLILISFLINFGVTQLQGRGN